MNKSLRILASIAVLFLLTLTTAHAEVTVSVTLSGSVEEMLPILQHLRDMGVGVGQTSAADDGIKLQVHSMTTEQEVQSAPEAPAPPPAPVLGLADAVITPPQVKPGEKAIISVKVTDPDRVVDTIDASIGDSDVDLADTGANGDAVAGDGIWSAAIDIPAGTPDGPYAVKITAYDAHGYPLVTPGPIPEGAAAAPPLTAEATVTISR